MIAVLDAVMHAQFADAGMADFGEYRASAMSAPFGQQVLCFIDRSSNNQGFEGQGSYADITVRLIKQAGLAPAAGGLIDITGERFELRAIVEGRDDESAVTWAVVSRGPVPVPAPAPP